MHVGYLTEGGGEGESCYRLRSVVIKNCDFIDYLSLGHIMLFETICKIYFEFEIGL